MREIASSLKLLAMTIVNYVKFKRHKKENSNNNANDRYYFYVGLCYSVYWLFCLSYISFKPTNFLIYSIWRVHET